MVYIKTCCPCLDIDRLPKSLFITRLPVWVPKVFQLLAGHVTGLSLGSWLCHSAAILVTPSPTYTWRRIIESVTVSYNSYISLFAYRIHRLVILIPKDLHSTVIRNEDHSPKSKTLRPLLNVAYNYKLYIGLLYWYKKIYNSHTKWISQDHDPKSKTLRPLLNFT